MRTPMTWKARAAGLLILAGAITACGSGGGSDGVASLSGSGSNSAKKSQQSSDTKKDPQEAFRAFAQCMREHGIDMPDPQVSKDAKGGGGFTVGIPSGSGGASGPTDEFKKANEACKKHLDGVVRGGNGKGPSDADLEKVKKQSLAFAKCMREHGIDFPDPTFDGGMVQIGPSGSIDPNDPQLQAAMKQCQKQAGLPRPGRGFATNGKSA
jgi:hypothetical protein